MDLPVLAASRLYRPEVCSFLHEAFEAFWHREFLRAWKLSALVAASPLQVEFRPGGCAPTVFEALRGEMTWAMDEIRAATETAVDLRECGRGPGDIKVAVALIDQHGNAEAHTAYGRSLAPIPIEAAGLSIHGQVLISRRFLSSNWRWRAELRRVCLQSLGEIVGLARVDVASCWCRETSLLRPAQLRALLALGDVKNFFESLPSIQQQLISPLWPRSRGVLPTHAACTPLHEAGARTVQP